ncbi:MAG: ABC transporter ATP-binding protein [Pirellulales bacterium]
MFRLEGVSKTYSRPGSQVTALRADSLEIPAGSYVAIVGPSGSGKSTLLSMLGGMLSPTTGRIWLGDVSLYDLSLTERARLRREKIGFVFQTFNLVPYLTAIENVQIPLCLSRMPSDDQFARAAALLERVGLSQRLGHRPSELSIGQQQRVALARTLANRPSIILADEPTGNLDAESRQVVLDFFDELHRDGCTIVTVTHDKLSADKAKWQLSITNGVVSTAEEAQPARAA